MSGSGGVVDWRSVSVVRFIDVNVEALDERADQVDAAAGARVVDRLAPAAVQPETVRQLNVAAAVDQPASNVKVTERDGDVKRRRTVVQYPVQQSAQLRRRRAQNVDDSVHLHQPI